MVPVEPVRPGVLYSIFRTEICQKPLYMEPVFEKMKFYCPIKSKNKNGKINNGRNYILFSPSNKSNNLRKKLIMTTYSNSNSINLSKASKEPKC